MISSFIGFIESRTHFETPSWRRLWENARLSSFVVAIAIGDLVKSILGLKGMDKILISVGRGSIDSKVEVTNDSATI